MDVFQNLFGNLGDLKPGWLLKGGRVAVLVLVGFPLLRLAGFFVRSFTKKRFSQQASLLTGKAVTYSGTAILAVMVLHELGFNLTALLGAAGIVGVALSFASQTSVSNVISGLFLLSEKFFKVGDIIRYGDKTGVVHSVDLLSIKLRTFDNQYIRVPNDSFIKSETTNVTHFPIRRMDFNIGVAYKEDIARVMEILRTLADENPHCLDEPQPIVVFKGFGESSLDILLGVWFHKDHFLALKNSLTTEIKERFDKENIEIPFPHRVIYTGAVTPAFPVELKKSQKTQPPE